MKKIYTLLLSLIFSISVHAQTIFWIENFNNGCTAGCDAGSYAGTNGAWTITNTGSNSTTPNQWFVSCAENGRAPGQCGQGCGNDATLHVGANPGSECTCFACNDPSGDCGAAYDACSFGAIGGLCGNTDDAHTDKRAESPVIDCSAYNTITITFNYLEGGQTTIDNATLWYYDGAAWTQIADMNKTTMCVAQGKWGSFTQALPASADNNPNVRIGFRWVNNSDDIGSDPSFAVDSVRLTVPSLGAPPIANFSQGNTAGCDSLCVTFTDSSSQATSWSWSFPGGNPSTSALQNPVVCYNTPGSYDVIQVVSNSFGTDTLVKPNLVTITPTPVPNFSSTSQYLCVGDCIDYTDLSTGVVQAYVWTFQGGTPLNSSDQNPTNVCYTVAGAFNTTLTVSNGGCTNSNTHVGYINVSQPAQPIISNIGGDTLLSTPALTYQWYQVGVGPIPAGIFQYFIASNSGGAYYVCITDALGCEACSDTFYYSPESVHEFNLSEAFHVYPNPAHGKVEISNTSKISKCALQISDVTGKRVKHDSVSFIQGKAEVTLEEIAKGTYLLQLLDDKQQVIFSTQLVIN